MQRDHLSYRRLKPPQEVRDKRRDAYHEQASEYPTDSALGLLKRWRAWISRRWIVFKIHKAPRYRPLNDHISAARIAVPMSETTIDPMQPSRLE